MKRNHEAIPTMKQSAVLSMYVHSQKKIHYHLKKIIICSSDINLSK